VRSAPIALAVIVVTCASPACLVTVDESLVDKATGPSTTAARPNDGGAAEAGDAAPEASVYAGMACGKGGHCFPSAGQVCCTGSDGDPNPANGSCGNAPDCQTGDFFRCMGPADCADAVLNGPAICCATDFSGGGFSRSGCKAACVAGDVELCDPNGPVCPTPRTCRPSTEYVGLYACQ
jgi:hypothetical protein